MQVISQDDEEECEEVLTSLEKNPERERKLNELNEEGLTLIHCAARCDGTHSLSGECTRLQSLKRLIMMGAGMPRGGGRGRVEVGGGGRSEEGGGGRLQDYAIW